MLQEADDVADEIARKGVIANEAAARELDAKERHSVVVKGLLHKAGEKNKDYKQVARVGWGGFSWGEGGAGGYDGIG